MILKPYFPLPGSVTEIMLDIMDQEDGEFIDSTLRFVQQVSKINEYNFPLAVLVVKPRQHFLTKDVTQPLLSPDQPREEGGDRGE